MSRSARPSRFRGKWRIRWIDHDGHRSSAVFDTYGEADRALRTRQLEAEEIRRGNRRAPPPTPPPNRTVKDLCEYWLANRAPLKRSKEDDHSIIHRHLIPGFGSVPLEDLSAEHVDTFVASRSHLSPKTIRNHLTLLSTMFSHACSMAWLRVMPIIKKPSAYSGDSMDHENRPWLRSVAEIRRVLDATRTEVLTDDPEVSMPHFLYAAAIYTGLRAGELAGLRWTDVDLDRRVIRVSRSYDGNTKTPASRRHVPIVDVLVPMLVEWKGMCPETAEGLVFPNRAGNMLEPASRIFRETLHRFLDKAGFPRPTEGRRTAYLNFHAFRHSFACHYMLAGGTIERLVRILGHTSKTMSEHYANVGAYAYPDDLSRFNGHAISA